MKRLRAHFSFLVVAAFAFASCALLAADEQQPLPVSVCELAAQPRKFDGQQVKGTGIYAIGAHSAVLYDICDGKPKTVGITLAPTYKSDTHRHKVLASRAQESGVRVSFVGVFRSAPGIFLDRDSGIVVETLQEMGRKKR